MASIKKILRENKNKKISTYWQVSYYDNVGKRHRKNFKKQSSANVFRVKIENELQSGIHLPDNESTSVEAAADHFINNFEKLVIQGKRERSSLHQYKSHIKNHIKTSKLKNMLLNQLQTKHCHGFLNELNEKSVSDQQSAKILFTLRTILERAQEQGWIKSNPAKSVKVTRNKRQKTRIQIPDKKTIQAVLLEAEKAGPWQLAFVFLGFFCGLRASELRGLLKENIKFGENPHVEIVQRADQWGKIGNPKTEKSTRIIPMGKDTAKVVKAWVDQSPHAFLFANKAGKPSNHSNLRNRFWTPLKKACGIKTAFGFHVMRHVCASLWIGSGYNPKQIQELMGHATLAMTMDTYGHLWHDAREAQKCAIAVERSILGTN